MRTGIYVQIFSEIIYMLQISFKMNTYLIFFIRSFDNESEIFFAFDYESKNFFTRKSPISRIDMGHNYK